MIFIANKKGDENMKILDTLKERRTYYNINKQIKRERTEK